MSRPNHLRPGRDNGPILQAIRARRAERTTEDLITGLKHNLVGDSPMNRHALISCLLVCLAAVTGMADDAAWQTFDTAGWLALERQDYAAAKQQFDAAIRHAPAEDQRLGRSLVGLAWARHEIGLILRQPANNLPEDATPGDQAEPPDPDEPEAAYRTEQQEANRLARRAEKLTEKPATTQEQVTRAENKHILGRTELHLLNFDVAGKPLQEAADLFRELPGQDERLSRVLRSLAELRTEQGRYFEAAAHYAEARQRTRSQLDTIEILVEQVNVLTGLGQYRSAAQLLREYRSLARQLDIELDTREDAVEVNVGPLAAFEKESYERDRMRYDDATNRADFFDGRLNYCLGEYLAAESLFEGLEDVDLPRRFPRDRCNNLIRVLAAKSLIARGLHEHAADKLVGINGPAWEEQLIEGDKYEVEGAIALVTGEANYNTAAECFRLAILCKEAVYGKKHPLLAEAILGRMTALDLQGDQQAAVPGLFDRVSQVCATMQAQQHPYVAHGLALLAMYHTQHDYRQDGERSDKLRDLEQHLELHFERYENAQSAVDRALELLQLTDLSKHPIKAFALEQKAFVEWAQARPLPPALGTGEPVLPPLKRQPDPYAKAQSSAEKALQIRKDILDKVELHPTLAASFLQRGWIEISRGSKSITYFEDAKQHLVDHPLRAEALLGELVRQVHEPSQQQQYERRQDDQPRTDLEPAYDDETVVEMKRALLARLGPAQTRDKLDSLANILFKHGRLLEAEWLAGLADTTFVSQPVGNVGNATRVVPHRTLLQRLRDWRLRRRR